MIFGDIGTGQPARSGALDELLSSGALTDLTSTRDDIQEQLDAAKGSADIDAQLAALKTQIAGELPAAEEK